MTLNVFSFIGVIMLMGLVTKAAILLVDFANQERGHKAKLQAVVDSGQLGIFKNGYWDNPAYLLPPEADLMATTHYLEALDLQKDIALLAGGDHPVALL